MGFVTKIFGSGKKAAKIQADATLKAANLQASSDRENARAATLTMENMAAQSRAADQAAEKLSRPMGEVNVLLAPETETPELDPETKRRRTARTPFFKQPSSSNIRI